MGIIPRIIGELGKELQKIIGSSKSIIDSPPTCLSAQYSLEGELSWLFLPSGNRKSYKPSLIFGLCI